MATETARFDAAGIAATNAHDSLLKIHVTPAQCDELALAHACLQCD
jgi:hypothetical protein